MSRPDRHRRPLDTRPSAHAIQVEVYRRLGPEERVAMAVEMSEEARLVTLQGIEQRFPDWNTARCRRELFRRIHGAGLVERAWGDGTRDDE